MSRASREHNGNAIKNVSIQARGWRHQAGSQSGACKSTLAFRGLQAPWLISQTFPELMVMLKHRNPLIWLKKQFRQQNCRQLLCSLEQREEKAPSTRAALPTDTQHAGSSQHFGDKVFMSFVTHSFLAKAHLKAIGQVAKVSQVPRWGGPEHFLSISLQMSLWRR